MAAHPNPPCNEQTSKLTKLAKTLLESFDTSFFCSKIHKFRVATLWWVGTTIANWESPTEGDWPTRIRSRGGRKKVYPVAGTVWGHSLETPGPWTPPYIPVEHLQTPSTTRSPRSLHLAFFSSLHLALFIPHPPPLTHHLNAPALPAGIHRR